MTAPTDEEGGVVLHELVADALRNLNAVRQRSLLALLGIAIGTAAVVAMISTGENAKHQSMRQFLAMGTDILAIQKDFAVPGGPQAALTAADAPALTGLPDIEAAAPLALVGVEVAHGRTRLPATVAGVGSDLFPLARLRAERGRVLTGTDRSQTFVVLGAGLAARLAGEGRAPGVGDLVRMGGYNHTVIGVLAQASPNPLLPIDVDNTAFVPLAGVRRVTPNSDITNILVRKAPAADDRAVQRSIAAYFSGGPQPRPVMVQSARQLIAAMAEQARVHTLLLSAIGGVSLIVGGVGVMNVMLMSVVERRREIGLRLALGARPRDVRAMFLVEALVLSLIGGGVGVALGGAAAALHAWSVGWGFVPSMAALPLGVGMSSGVGLFFGLYPAIQASRLEPIAALRSD